MEVYGAKKEKRRKEKEEKLTIIDKINETDNYNNNNNPILPNRIKQLHLALLEPVFPSGYHHTLMTRVHVIF